MKHLHKPHELPSAMDSNAAQFARQGNPWSGDGRIKRGRRKRRVPTCRAGTPRIPERDSRSEIEAFADIQARRAIDALIKSASGKSRTVAPAADAPRPVVPTIRPARDCELSGWQRFERQVTRCKQRADVLRRLAEGKERTRIADEKARLKALIKAAELRLAKL